MQRLHANAPTPHSRSNRSHIILPSPSLSPASFFLFAVPRQRVWFTPHGDCALYAFLLQQALLSFIGPAMGRALTPWPWVPDTEPMLAGVRSAADAQGDSITIAVLILSSILFTYLLTSPAVVAMAGWAVKPEGWLTPLCERIGGMWRRGRRGYGFDEAEAHSLLMSSPIRMQQSPPGGSGAGAGAGGGAGAGAGAGGGAGAGPREGANEVDEAEGVVEAGPRGACWEEARGAVSGKPSPATRSAT